MANQSPWSLLQNRGELALASGEVSPEQAINNFQKVAGLIGKPSFFNKTPYKAPSLESLNVPAQDPEQGYQAMKIDPVAKGSGMYGRKELEDLAKKYSEDTVKELSSKVATTGIMMSPEDYQAAISNVEKLPLIQEQKKGISDIEQLLQMQASQPSDYLTGPLAGWLRAEHGKDVSGFLANKGISPDEKIKAYVAGMDKLQTDRRDLSKAVMSGVPNQKFGTIVDKTTQELINKKQEELQNKFKEILGAKDPAMADRTPKLNPNVMPVSSRAKVELRNKFNAEVKPIEMTLKTSDELSDLVSNTGPGKVLTKKVVETSLARLRGEVGALATYDVQGTAEARDIGSRLEAYFTTLADGELTEDNKKAVMDLLRLYKASAKRVLENVKNKYADQGANDYAEIGLGRDEIMKSLVTNYREPEKKAEVKKPSKKLEDMTDAELDAYEQSLKGGK